MNRKDALVRLTARLLARRDALRKTLSGDLDTIREASQAQGVGDDVDAAIDSANDEIYSQLVEFESKELAQIERALERIAAGKFGRCEHCGGKIPAARLEVLPYTTTCIECQRANERAGTSRVRSRDSKQWANVRDTSLEEDLEEALARTELSFGGFDIREPTERFSRSVLV